jgi:hypothetical protein
MLRKTMASVVLLIPLLAVSAEPPAQAGVDAKQKLERVKKKSATLLNTPAIQDVASSVELRRVRAYSDTDAKAVVAFRWAGEHDVLLTVYLKYYDGQWTVVREAWSHDGFDQPARDVAASITEAIDETTEK